ncbi:MAG: hypothetical protein ACPGYV_01440 [Phycisphaeraceae bacterium]
MPQRIIFFLAALSLLVFAPAGREAAAYADDEVKAEDLPDDALKFSKPKATLYDELILIDSNKATGIEARIKSERYNFLHLRFVINYKLPEGTETIQVDSNDISLVENGGKTHPVIGAFDENRIYSNWARSVWLRERSSRKNEFVDRIYAIPKDATGPYALVINDLKTLRVELPENISKPPHPSQMVDVEIKSIAWGDSVKGEMVRVGKDNIDTQFEVPGRRLLAVSLLVDALDYNDDDGKSLNWNGQALSIRDNQGNLHACHGGFFAGRLNPHAGHTSVVGEKTEKSETFFFSPPDEIESFELLWYGRPVASHKMKK